MYVRYAYMYSYIHVRLAYSASLLRVTCTLHVAGEYKATQCGGRAKFDQVTCVKCLESCPAGFYKEGNCDVGNRTADILCKPVSLCLIVHISHVFTYASSCKRGLHLVCLLANAIQ
jgi:hypothetical protein